MPSTPTAPFTMDAPLYAYLAATHFQFSISDNGTTVRDLFADAEPSKDGTGYVIGRRPVTPHGVSFELGTVSNCLANTADALRRGELTAETLARHGVTPDMIQAARAAVDAAYDRLK